MDYLARREHSAAELKRKLLAKGFDEQEVTRTLERLQREKLQSDVRFAQSYLHYRQSKGFGPLKIYHELKTKGVSQEIIELAEADEACDWFEHLKKLEKRKYNGLPAKDYKEQQKRSRFLQQRGFAIHDIMRLFTHT